GGGWVWGGERGGGGVGRARPPPPLHSPQSEPALGPCALHHVRAIGWGVAIGCPVGCPVCKNTKERPRTWTLHKAQRVHGSPEDRSAALAPTLLRLGSMLAALGVSPCILDSPWAYRQLSLRGRSGRSGPALADPYRNRQADSSWRVVSSSRMWPAMGSSSPRQVWRTPQSRARQQGEPRSPPE